MGTCPNCGAYVSPGTNVCSCGTTFGSYSPKEEKREPTELEIKREKQRKVINGYWQHAKALMEEGRYIEAIGWLDMAIEVSPSSLYIFRKGVACYGARMYEDALALFKESINPRAGIDNYPKYSWIGDTLIELGRFDEAVHVYENAISIIEKDYERKMKFHEEERWDPPSDAYLKSLLDEKNARVSEIEDCIAYCEKRKAEAAKAENSYWDTERLLREIGRENLITVTGTFYHGSSELRKGMWLKMVREPGNAYDSDAVAVYLEGEKIGYVANTDRTACHLTSKASEIEIIDGTFAEYVLYYANRYHIAKIN